MSHILTIKALFLDKEILQDVVKKMGGKILGEGSHDISHYNPNRKGLGIKLPGMSYNMVVAADGSLEYESMDHVGETITFQQNYAVEKVSRELAMQGQSIQSSDTTETSTDVITVMEIV